MGVVNPQKAFGSPNCLKRQGLTQSYFNPYIIRPQGPVWRIDGKYMKIAKARNCTQNTSIQPKSSKESTFVKFSKCPFHLGLSSDCLLAQRASSQHPSLRLQTIVEEILQACIFPRTNSAHKDNIRKELAEICTITYPRDSCMKGVGKCQTKELGAVERRTYKKCYQAARVNKV